MRWDLGGDHLRDLAGSIGDFDDVRRMEIVSMRPSRLHSRLDVCRSVAM